MLRTGHWSGGRGETGGIAVGVIQEVAYARRVGTSRRTWERRYVVAVVGASALIAVIKANMRYGGHPLASQPLWQRGAVTATLVLMWLAAIAASRSYEPRFLGLGSEEYRRILVAALALMATVATASWATNATIARSQGPERRRTRGEEVIQCFPPS